MELSQQLRLDQLASLVHVPLEAFLHLDDGALEAFLHPDQVLLQFCIHTLSLLPWQTSEAGIPGNPVSWSAPDRISSEVSLTVEDLPPGNAPQRWPNRLLHGRTGRPRARNRRGGMDRGSRPAGRCVPTGYATKIASPRSRRHLPTRPSP